MESASSKSPITIEADVVPSLATSRSWRIIARTATPRSSNKRNRTAPVFPVAPVIRTVFVADIGMAFSPLFACVYLHFQSIVLNERRSLNTVHCKSKSVDVNFYVAYEKSDCENRERKS